MISKNQGSTPSFYWKVELQEPPKFNNNPKPSPHSISIFLHLEIPKAGTERSLIPASRGQSFSFSLTLSSPHMEQPVPIKGK